MRSADIIRLLRQSELGRKSDCTWPAAGNYTGNCGWLIQSGWAMSDWVSRQVIDRQLPSRWSPVMYQRWTKLLFLHWRWDQAKFSNASLETGRR